jgi:rSAM/selenodomain-associated transferase 2
MISVVVPVLDEAATIAGGIRALRDGPVDIEVVVVDGGSTDGTREIARELAALVEAPRGRARQMNAGAAAARGDTLLFLHADAQLDRTWAADVEATVASGVVGGTFTQTIDAPGWPYRLIERAGNWRARRLRTFYGDAGVFVTRTAFDRIGGFPDVPIGEEFGFSRALRALGRTVVLDCGVRVSARRWQRLGVARVTLTNWAIAALLHARVSPSRVARLYDVVR